MLSIIRVELVTSVKYHSPQLIYELRQPLNSLPIGFELDVYMYHHSYAFGRFRTWLIAPLFLKCTFFCCDPHVIDHLITSPRASRRFACVVIVRACPTSVNYHLHKTAYEPAWTLHSLPTDFGLDRFNKG